MEAEEAGILVSYDQDFRCYSKCVTAINEQKNKQMKAGINGQPE